MQVTYRLRVQKGVLRCEVGYIDARVYEFETQEDSSGGISAYQNRAAIEFEIQCFIEFTEFNTATGFKSINGGVKVRGRTIWTRQFVSWSCGEAI